MSKIDFESRSDCRQGSVGGIDQGVCGEIIHRSWTCTDCGHETTLRSGTVMQGSKLPVSTGSWQCSWLQVPSGPFPLWRYSASLEGSGISQSGKWCISCVTWWGSGTVSTGCLTRWNSTRASSPRRCLTVKKGTSQTRARKPAEDGRACHGGEFRPRKHAGQEDLCSV